MFAGRIMVDAAIVLVAATAPAAAKTQRARQPGDQQVLATAPAPPAHINSESPELTGGGSLGHNEMKSW